MEVIQGKSVLMVLMLYSATPVGVLTPRLSASDRELQLISTCIHTFSVGDLLSSKHILGTDCQVIPAHKVVIYCKRPYNKAEPAATSAAVK